MCQYYRATGLTFLFLFIFAVSYSTPPVTICQLGGNSTGLVALWHLNENNTAQVDASPNGLTAQVRGSAVFTTSGKCGGAYTIAAGKYVEEPTSSTLTNITSAITIAAWIYPTNPTVNYQVIVARSDGSVDAQYEFRLKATTGKLGFASKAGGSYGDETCNGTVLQANQWYLAVVTYNVAGNLNWYLNGIKDGDTVNTGVGMNSQARSLRIGNRGDSIIPFLGVIDEVAIWDRVLSAAEIYNIYYRNPKCEVN